MTTEYTAYQTAAHSLDTAEQSGDRATITRARRALTIATRRALSVHGPSILPAAVRAEAV